MCGRCVALALLDPAGYRWPPMFVRLASGEVEERPLPTVIRVALLDHNRSFIAAWGNVADVKDAAFAVLDRLRAEVESNQVAPPVSI